MFTVKRVGLLQCVTVTAWHLPVPMPLLGLTAFASCLYREMGRDARRSHPVPLRCVHFPALIIIPICARRGPSFSWRFAVTSSSALRAQQPPPPAYSRLSRVASDVFCFDRQVQEFTALVCGRFADRLTKTAGTATLKQGAGSVVCGISVARRCECGKLHA